MKTPLEIVSGMFKNTSVSEIKLFDSVKNVQIGVYQVDEGFNARYVLAAFNSNSRWNCLLDYTIVPMGEDKDVASYAGILAYWALQRLQDSMNG